MWSQQWSRYLSVAVWQIIPQCTASTKTTICCLSISEGQESGENLTWVVRVHCLWWAWNQLSTWTVALWRLDWGSVLTAVHPLRLAVAKAASGLRWPLVWGLELLSTWAFPKGCSGHVHGLPLPGQMISKRKEETEQKTERAGSFITWCWKWHTFASALPGWSHKPTLAQCGRGEDRVWIPEGSVRAPSWRLIFVPQWYSCSVSG